MRNTRPDLNNLKLYPNGAKVLILEGNAETKSTHAGMVQDNAQRAVPNTNTSRLSSELTNMNKYNTGIKGYIQTTFLGSLRDRTEDFKKVGAFDKSKRPDAINISEGWSEIAMWNHILDNQASFIKKASPEERKLLFLKTKDNEEVISSKKLESYIDTCLEDAKPEIDKAKEDLSKEVKKLKDKNIAVVVAIGNDNEDIEWVRKNMPDIKFEEDEGIDMLQSIEGVINVGASGKNGKLTDYSTRSELIDFSATVPYADQDEAGTSFTAPAFAALLAKRMKEKNMTVDEAVADLKKEGKQMKDEEGNVYTYLAPKLFSGTEDYPKGKPRNRRPAIQEILRRENKKKEDTLNSGESQRA